MNILFLGTPYELAEKYGNVSKILFLCLFYCSIFPASFFLCAISLFVTYQVEKWALLRHWKRAPPLEDAIPTAIGTYVLPLIVGIMALTNSFYWTGFPYDNLCVNDDGSSIDYSYIGTFALETTAASVAEYVTVTYDDNAYRFCNMNYHSNFFPDFPYVPYRDRKNIDSYEYMSEDQILSTTYFGWSAFGILVLILFRFCLRWYQKYRRNFSDDYKPIGRPSRISFSETALRCAYIPQVRSKSFPFPLIACTVDHVDPSCFTFKPDKPYTYYDLTSDAKKILGSEDTMDPLAFTTVKTWRLKRF